MHGVHGIWTQWVVANSKAAIAAVLVKEPSKIHTLKSSDAINDWITFHYREENVPYSGKLSRERTFADP